MEIGIFANESDDNFLGSRDLDDEYGSEYQLAASPDPQAPSSSGPPPPDRVEVAEEPAGLIASRVIFALLVSVSLVLNLLLLLAVLRRRRVVHVIYALSAAFLLPDVIFYTKLVVELVDWGAERPAWAKSDWSCGLWQFGTHLYPLLYSFLLVAIVYHAFVTLFLDYSGSYEERARRWLPALIAAICAVGMVLATPSAFYAGVAVESEGEQVLRSHFRQYCSLSVPSLLAPSSTPGIRQESEASFRLVYELVLPYVMPLVFLGFPYVTLLVGLMRSVPAANHSEHATKMTCVVTLWLVTSYLMLHVATVMRNAFSVFNVWHRLVAMLDAYDDERVPRFQTYLQVVAYVLTCVWGIARATLCFKYNAKLRKALGP